MNAMQQLLTEHMAIWTAADTEKKSGRGRASGNAGSVYGIKKLRELILELAVRGKLVPQDANDEPASELLKHIQAEKAKLIAEGKLKKEKPLAPITQDEKPFELPHGWVLVRLNQIAILENGDRGKNYPNKDTLVSEGVPFVNAGHLDNGLVNKSEMTFITPERFSLLSGGKFIENDILFCLRGSLGKSAVVKDLSTGAIASSLVIIRVNTNVQLNYFYNYLKSNLLMQSIRKYDNGTAQPNLSSTDLAKFVIPIPPLAEQHRIVAKVDELMALCDQLEAQHSNAAEAHEKLVSHLLGTLTQSQSADDFSANWQRIAAHFDTLFTTEASIDALKQTLLQLAVMGKLVQQDTNDEPASELLKHIQTEKTKLISEGKIKKDKPIAPISDDEKPFELPKKWEWARLELLANLITKGSSPKWQGVNYTNNTNDVLFVTSENVGSYSLLLDSPKFVEAKFNEIEPRSILQKGDYLMNIVGASIGRTATFDRDDVANINQAVCLIRIENQALSKSYLLHFFNSQTCLEYMFDKQVDNARPNLSMGNIAKFLIPIAPEAEQHRIVAKVDALMALCDQLKTRIKHANQQKNAIADALVAQAVTA